MQWLTGEFGRNGSREALVTGVDQAPVHTAHRIKRGDLEKKVARWLS